MGFRHYFGTSLGSHGPGPSNTITDRVHRTVRQGNEEYGAVRIKNSEPQGVSNLRTNPKNHL